MRNFYDYVRYSTVTVWRPPKGNEPFFRESNISCEFFKTFDFSVRKKCLNFFFRKVAAWLRNLTYLCLSPTVRNLWHSYADRSKFCLSVRTTIETCTHAGLDIRLKRIDLRVNGPNRSYVSVTQDQTFRG